MEFRKRTDTYWQILPLYKIFEAINVCLSPTVLLIYCFIRKGTSSKHLCISSVALISIMSWITICLKPARQVLAHCRRFGIKMFDKIARVHYSFYQISKDAQICNDVYWMVNR